MLVYEGIVFIYYWLKALSIGSSIIRSSLLQTDTEDVFDDELSELATRNLLSWTFFSEGIRREEKPLWTHEWLEILVDREDGEELSESSSSDLEDEVSNGGRMMLQSNLNTSRQLSKTRTCGRFLHIPSSRRHGLVIHPPGSVPSGPPPG